MKKQPAAILLQAAFSGRKRAFWLLTATAASAKLETIGWVSFTAPLLLQMYLSIWLLGDEFWLNKSCELGEAIEVKISKRG
ncbi:hypothetical protein [Sporomusa termitida]|uniref:hypothetical protein n=1 Tax=Sporomusa termitida TaxID=2377 RepID=UPI001187217C|nr:hypothetical protein [Sporomusa termitida]